MGGPVDFGMVVRPRSETEHGVTAIWTEVLGRRPDSIDDEFLAVGGDSPRAARLLGRVFDRWRVKVSLQEFQARSSIAGLSATIERKVAEARTRENEMLSAALAELEALSDHSSL